MLFNQGANLVIVLFFANFFWKKIKKKLRFIKKKFIFAENF